MDLRVLSLSVEDQVRSQSNIMVHLARLRRSCSMCQTLEGTRSNIEALQSVLKNQPCVVMKRRDERRSAKENP